jgi:hypothetical protein
MSNTRNLEQANRLIHETSPYLLQHAHNPVDWYPWGDEALARAAEEDKPIFLSIGYSACHWCHVMEQESFEDEETAAFLNEHFVCIKVDREERPDLDDIYMTAVQLIAGGGGWPMSVFLAPNMNPFYGGTYFPPMDMYGRPGFMTVLRNVVRAWQEKRDQIQQSSEEITGAIERHLSGRYAPGGEVTGEVFDKAAADLRKAFDPVEGGFGPAPKFPAAAAVGLLLRQYLRGNDPSLIEMATTTLTKMARGGIYDQIGGGFHRYSTDERWLAPHFEKMIYDNAQMSRAYLEAFQLTGNVLYKRVAAETLDYVLREMRDERGGFFSAQDADSEGVEGRFYVWTKREITDILGEDGARLFAAYFFVEEDGNFPSQEPFHAGRNILHVPRPEEAVAKDLRMDAAEFQGRIDELRKRVLAARENRVRPGTDDKVLTSWNALTISALAHGYRVLGDRRYLDAATRAADFILTYMTRDGQLLRTYRLGEARLPAYLDDYSFLAMALIDLYETTFDMIWLDRADEIALETIARFWDTEGGAFFFTDSSHTNLIARPKPTFDGAEPSGNSMAAYALLRLGKYTGNQDHLQKARRVIESNVQPMKAMPQGFLKMLEAADFLEAPTREIAIAGPIESDATQALLAELNRRFVPHKIVAVYNPLDESAADTVERIPLLRGKDMKGGQATAYVCRNHRCQEPVTTPEGLAIALGFGPPGERT